MTLSKQVKDNSDYLHRISSWEFIDYQQICSIITQKIQIHSSSALHQKESDCFIRQNLTTLLTSIFNQFLPYTLITKSRSSSSVQKYYNFYANHKHSCHKYIFWYYRKIMNSQFQVDASLFRELIKIASLQQNPISFSKVEHQENETSIFSFFIHRINKAEIVYKIANKLNLQIINIKVGSQDKLQNEPLLIFFKKLKSITNIPKAQIAFILQILFCILYHLSYQIKADPPLTGEHYFVRIAQIQFKIQSQITFKIRKFESECEENRKFMTVTQLNNILSSTLKEWLIFKHTFIYLINQREHQLGKGSFGCVYKSLCIGLLNYEQSAKRLDCFVKGVALKQLKLSNEQYKSKEYDVPKKREEDLLSLIKTIQFQNQMRQIDQQIYANPSTKTLLGLRHLIDLIEVFDVSRQTEKSDESSQSSYDSFSYYAFEECAFTLSLKRADSQNNFPFEDKSSYGKQNLKQILYKFSLQLALSLDCIHRKIFENYPKIVIDAFKQQLNHDELQCNHRNTIKPHHAQQNKLYECLGIYHRDLKPKNIVIKGKALRSLNFDLKLIDWGMGKITNIKSLRKGIRCGTKCYQSPEMMKQGKYNEKTDVWAYGIMLYEVLNEGSKLYDSTKAEHMKEVLAHLLDKIKILEIKCGQSFCDDHSIREWLFILRKCLAIDVKSRWSSHQLYQYLLDHEYELNGCIFNHTFKDAISYRMVDNKIQRMRMEEILTKEKQGNKGFRVRMAKNMCEFLTKYECNRTERINLFQFIVAHYIHHYLSNQPISNIQQLHIFQKYQTNQLLQFFIISDSNITQKIQKKSIISYVKESLVPQFFAKCCKCNVISTIDSDNILIVQLIEKISKQQNQLFDNVQTIIEFRIDGNEVRTRRCNYNVFQFERRVSKIERIDSTKMSNRCLVSLLDRILDQLSINSKTTLSSYRQNKHPSLHQDYISIQRIRPNQVNILIDVDKYVDQHAKQQHGKILQMDIYERIVRIINHSREQIVFEEEIFVFLAKLASIDVEDTQFPSEVNRLHRIIGISRIRIIQDLIIEVCMEIEYSLSQIRKIWRNLVGKLLNQWKTLNGDIKNIVENKITINNKQSQLSCYYEKERSSTNKKLIEPMNLFNCPSKVLGSIRAIKNSQDQLGGILSMNNQASRHILLNIATLSHNQGSNPFPAID